MTEPLQIPAPNRLNFRAWDGQRMRCEDDFYIRGGVVYRFTEFDGPVACDWIPMQSTGLADTNGVEIFEGDIVMFTYWWFDGNVAESQLRGVIVYSPELMSFQMKGVKNKDWQRHTGYNDSDYMTPFSELNFDKADFHVIGNIHQHPHLLESEEA